ncbi:hypothetical protein GCM10022237_41880 [Nocardioides ginsengisoli]|uniref:Uncharacterized protein n=1 Tax=Nocardioides ginsengisoli TaxID=363868 RepID=A0ABW3W3Z1_9ACTN
MTRITAFLACLAVGVAVAVVPATSSSATTEPGGGLVSETPAAITPHVLNGEVLSIAAIGRTIVLAGTFTRVREYNGTTTLIRHRLLAFDSVTGRISTTFHPDPDDAVAVVIPGPANTVYVGGDFKHIGLVKRHRVARLSLATGAVIARFNAGAVNGTVQDLRLYKRRLYVAGAFTKAGGRKQGVLTTLRPATGKAQRYLQLAFRGVHRRGLGVPMVVKIDIAPRQRRLVAIGNFRRVGHRRHEQIVMLRLNRRGARLDPFDAPMYRATCSGSFFTYVRALDFSTDGAYFVVGTTGGVTGPTTPCDTVARFETGSRGAVSPSWIDHTGGDTILSVEATPSAVYVGGHQRWFNNPNGRNNAAPGAVSRTGIGALSPVNGLPFSWDPTHQLGVGIFDLLLTPTGLWVGSDTDQIAHTYHPRIGLLLPNGLRYPAVSTPVLPALTYLSLGDDLRARRFDGRTAGPSTELAAQPDQPTWSQVTGAFMLGGWLYVGARDGTFTRRTFDGTTYGAPQAVATSDRIVPLADWHRDLSVLTGLFYDRGRIYYTLPGSRALYYRYFNPESGVVGAVRLIASGPAGAFDPRQVRGMFVAGNALYWSTASGALHRMGWVQTAQAARAAGVAATVGGPNVDGVDWSTGIVFVGQGTASGRGG